MTHAQTKPIKVFRIFSRLNIGGPSQHVILLSDGLPPIYETTLITGKVGSGEGNMSYLLDSKRNYRHIFISELGRELHPFKDILALWRIWRLLKKEKPDIIHTHTSKAGVLGRVAAMGAGVPIRVHTFHGHIFQNYYGKTKTFLIKLAEKILAYFTTHIVAISAKQREDLVNTFKITSKHKISVIPLGFDLRAYNKNDDTTKESRQKWDISKNKFCIGIVGRLVPIKNHTFFLRVARQLLNIRKDIQFFIIGDGPCYHSLYREAKEMNITKNVSFLGWQKDLTSIYPMLDIVCLTSQNEGTPVSLIEAQAFGIPVIATDVGGTSDIVFPEKNGFLISPNNDQDLKDKILFLLDRPSLRKEMGSFGKKFVLENFDKARLLSDVDHLYLKLLKGGQPSRQNQICLSQD